MERKFTPDQPRPPAKARALPFPALPIRIDGARVTIPLVWAALSRLIEAEIDARRPFLWLAPLAILGVLLYFAAEREPALWAGPSLVIVSTGFLIAKRPDHRGLRAVLLTVAAIGLGFSSGTLRTWLKAAPILSETRIGPFEAVIETIDASATGARLQLRLKRFRGQTDQVPMRIRATLAGPVHLAPGDRIGGMIRLQPPPFPARPGGYDFARDAYFARIGAVGSILGRVSTLSRMESLPMALEFTTRVDQARIALSERIHASIGGQSGAVAAALFTGKRGYITDQTNDELRAAGIYHVVSISGLHMVLIAGLVYTIIRSFLTAVPGLALRRPIKSWAAAVAMAFACAYDVFAGSEVATERSLIMILILFGAILVGRQALSMRNLALAALVIVVLEPESVLGPSFQMSFAAVAALVAAFERGPGAPRAPLVKGRPPSEAPPPSLFGRISGWLLNHARTVALTTFVCEAATSSFSAFHFQRIQPLGIIGNALTIPLVEGLAMPIGCLGVLAMPFGLDGPLWRLMGVFVGIMLRVSALVASIPFATHALPAISLASVLYLAFGLVWLVLWSTPLRLAGVVPLLVGLGLAIGGSRADIVIARSGDGLAARGGDGRLAVMGKGTSAFVVGQWLAADGDMRLPADPSLRGGALCNGTGCVFRLTDGAPLYLSYAEVDLKEDCAAAKVLVTPLAAPEPCAPVTVDRNRLAAMGSIELVPNGHGGYTARGARSPDYDRPWSPKPPDTAPAAPPADAEGSDPTIDPVTPR